MPTPALMPLHKINLFFFFFKGTQTETDWKKNSYAKELRQTLGNEVNLTGGKRECEGQWWSPP